jgi:hypothetical protein
VVLEELPDLVGGEGVAGCHPVDGGEAQEADRVEDQQVPGSGHAADHSSARIA